MLSICFDRNVAISQSDETANTLEAIKIGAVLFDALTH